MTRNKEIGDHAENLACFHLQQNGMQLVSRNYRTPRGELDLIMRHGDELVFVEVRCRRPSHFSSAAESVDWHKQQRLIAAANHYLQRLGRQLPCRFDVVAITPDEAGLQIEWIPDAFRS